MAVITTTTGLRAPRRSPRNVLVVVVLALGALTAAALVWRTFAPTVVGGDASYVVTDGTSMLPHFVANGLVITHEESSYRVGEVVAYRNAQLHAVVMHRIVSRDGDRYVFKGDNNHFLDQYHAKPSDVVGAEWVYWPGAGRYLRIFRTPAVFAIVLAVLTVVGLRAPRPTRRRRRHHAW